MSVKAKKYLGQHFLTDETIAEKIFAFKLSDKLKVFKLFLKVFRRC